MAAGPAAKGRSQGGSQGGAPSHLRMPPAHLDATAAVAPVSGQLPLAFHGHAIADANIPVPDNGAILAPKIHASFPHTGESGADQAAEDERGACAHKRRRGFFRARACRLFFFNWRGNAISDRAWLSSQRTASPPAARRTPAHRAGSSYAPTASRAPSKSTAAKAAAITSGPAPALTASVDRICR